MAPKLPSLEVAELGLEPRTVGSLIFFRISYCFVFMLSLPGRTPVQRRVHQAQFCASPARSASLSSHPQHGACVEVECVSGRGSGARSGLPEAQAGPALRAVVLRKEVGGPLRGGWASDPGRSTAGPRSHGWK